MRELMERFLVLVNFFKGKEEGQGLAEYALILVLVAIVCVVALLFLGTSINTVLSNVGSTIVGAPS
jgi:pilus assembly protein Flp/PilA